MNLCCMFLNSCNFSLHCPIPLPVAISVLLPRAVPVLSGLCDPPDKNTSPLSLYQGHTTHSLQPGEETFIKFIDASRALPHRWGSREHGAPFPWPVTCWPLGLWNLFPAPLFLATLSCFVATASLLPTWNLLPDFSFFESKGPPQRSVSGVTKGPWK